MFGCGRDRNGIGYDFWGKGEIPQSVGRIALAFDDDLVVLDDLDIIFGKDGDTIVVAKLSNGYERA